MKDKARQLERIYNARPVTMEEALDAIHAGQLAVMCVIRNPNFDAAAYCYNLAEFRRFNYVSDDRPRTWMIIDDKAMVEDLSGYTSAQAWLKETEDKLTAPDVTKKEHHAEESDVKEMEQPVVDRSRSEA